MLCAAESESAGSTKQCNENEIKERKVERQEKRDTRGGEGREDIAQDAHTRLKVVWESVLAAMMASG